MAVCLVVFVDVISDGRIRIVQLACWLVLH